MSKKVYKEHVQYMKDHYENVSDFDSELEFEDETKSNESSKKQKKSEIQKQKDQEEKDHQIKKTWPKDEEESILLDDLLFTNIYHPGSVSEDMIKLLKVHGHYDSYKKRVAGINDQKNELVKVKSKKSKQNQKNTKT